MKTVLNPHRTHAALAPGMAFPSVNSAAVRALLSRCPKDAPTPLHRQTALVPDVTLLIKDERARMGLGSFKALGAAYVIAQDAAAISDAPGATTLQGRTYVTASAGNHGLSVAAGARVFGANAIVFIADTVPDSFAQRLAAKGAEVRREGRDYAASMAAAERCAATGEGVLLSDSSWAGYTEIPHRLMEGYLALAQEAIDQCDGPPTHILVQAGVGGMACAVAALARQVWADAPRLVVVEPAAAPALQASIEAGHAVTAKGPDSIMGRLDCKTPSLIALNGLARDADLFLTLPDEAVAAVLPMLAEAGLESSASGAAGLAAVLNPEARAACGIGPGARVLTFLSEQAA